MIITGGSRGIGRAVAESFLLAGDKVLLIARNIEELQKTQQELHRSYPEHGGGSRVVIHPADISDFDHAKEISEIIKRVFGGRVDVLVNAAGIAGPVGNIETLGDGEIRAWPDAFRINVYGTVLMCRVVLPFMKKHGGSIIAFSGGGEGPQPGMSAYVSSKGAVVRFMETFADEVKEYGITVNAIAPGQVDTQLRRDLEEKIEGARGRGTSVSPDLAARLVLFLCSEKTRGITGRLFSAKWDNMEEIAKHKEEIASSDMFRVIRIKPEDRGKDWNKGWKGF